jgi:hypothetical protein
MIQSSGLVVMIALSVAAGAGCASRSGYAAAPSGSFAEAYRAGEYQQAASLAAAVPAGDASAQLVRGMSLAEMGQDDQAAAVLTPLLRSRDSEIRGRAAAVLGLAARERGEKAEAAALLTIAAESLLGTDRVWAAHYAAELHKELGHTKEAAALAPIAGPAGAVLHVDPLGTYTIQFGSFSTEARASRHRRAMTLLAQERGLPAPTVEEVHAGARTLFAVRVGRYATKSDAVRIAADLPTETAVVKIQ